MINYTWQLNLKLVSIIIIIIIIIIIKPPLATTRAAQCIDAVHLFVCLSACLSVAKMQKNAIFSKSKQFRAMVSIDDLKEVVHGLFKEPIIWTPKIQDG